MSDDELVTVECLIRFADGSAGDVIEITRAEMLRRLPYVREVSLATFSDGPGWTPAARYENPERQPEPEVEAPAPVPVQEDIWAT